MIIEHMGKGWQPLVNRILDTGCDIWLIKEKWGCLRVFYNNASPEIKKIIDDIEKESETTCFTCGKDAIITCQGGYYLPLCSKCQV